MIIRISKICISKYVEIMINNSWKIYIFLLSIKDAKYKIRLNDLINYFIIYIL